MDKYIFHKKKALDRKTCQNIIQFLERSNLIENTRGYDYIDANLTMTEYESISKVLLSHLESGDFSKLLGLSLGGCW